MELDLSNADKRIHEEFHNFQIFGIGTPSHAQEVNRASRAKELDRVKTLTPKQLFIEFNKRTQKYNPAAAIPRAAVMALVRLNIYGFARKMYPAFLSQEQLKASHFDLANAAKVKTAWDNQIVPAWHELGGDESALQKAIIMGHNAPVFQTMKVKAGQRAEAGHGVDGDEYYMTPLQQYVDDFDFSMVKLPDYEDATGETYSYYDPAIIAAAIAAGGAIVTASLNSMAKKGGAADNPNTAGSPQAIANDKDLASANAANALNPPPLTSMDADEIKKMQVAALEDRKKNGLDPSTYEAEMASIDKQYAEATTILGMPKWLAITLGVTALAVGGFLIYRKIKKGKLTKS